jgi:divalent metal cation (Fe/Co/Zn/Cd) transporter
MHFKGILKAMKANGTSIEKSPRPVMRTATWLNICIGIIETVIGSATDSSAAASNGFRNILDSSSHAMHTATHKEEKDGGNNIYKVQRKRNWAAGAIAVGAMLTAVNSVDSIIQPKDEQLNIQALAVEIGSLAMSTGVIVALKRRYDDTLAYEDALRHHKVDASMAGLMSASIFMNQYIPGTDGFGGLVASGATAWLAYKTAKPHSHAHSIESGE